MLSEINKTEKDKYCIFSLICGKYKNQNSEKQRVGWWLSGVGFGEKGKILVKGHNFSVLRQVSPGDLRYNMVTIVKHTVLCT